MRVMNLWITTVILSAFGGLFAVGVVWADEPRKCKGTKELYDGECRYPDEIKELKSARPAKKAVKRAAAKPRKKAAEVNAGPSVRAGDLKARRERIQQIYKWGRGESKSDRKKLEALIKGDYEAFEKATAIRALGPERSADFIDALKKLAASNDLAVKSEAAILLYQWGEKDFARPLLEKLLTQGVALRRAFFKGIQDGKYAYDAEALPFFRAALQAKQIHVKLDAALGLLHLGYKGEALPAFEKALADQDKEYVRLTAVSYLASARDIPEARQLLKKATSDSSSRVSTRAKQILGTETPGTP